MSKTARPRPAPTARKLVPGSPEFTRGTRRTKAAQPIDCEAPYVEALRLAFADVVEELRRQPWDFEGSHWAARVRSRVATATATAAIGIMSDRAEEIRHDLLPTYLACHGASMLRGGYEPGMSHQDEGRVTPPELETGS